MDTNLLFYKVYMTMLLLFKCNINMMIKTMNTDHFPQNASKNFNSSPTNGHIKSAHYFLGDEKCILLYIDFVCCLVDRGSTDYLLLLQISSGFVWQTRDLHLSCNTLYPLSHRLRFFIVTKLDLCFDREDSLTS